MSRFWNFTNSGQDDNSVELRISGDIMDDGDAWIYKWFGIPHASPNAFLKELAQYKGKNITVWIDSYGGSVFAATGIYNALMEHKKTGPKITAKVTKAVSAATIPMMAADERLMTPGGIFMMHNPLPGEAVYGYASDLRKVADVLDVVKETIINAYVLSTGLSRAKISSMMDDETYMSAKTAIKEGFATGMLYSDEKELDIVDVMNLKYSHILAIQNAANDSVKKFFESRLVSAPQAAAPEPQSVANNNNVEGEQDMFKNVEELRNAHPDLVKQIEDAAREQGAKSERTRIQDIEKISKNVDPALVNKAKYEEPIDAKELAFQAMQKDQQIGTEQLQAAKNDTAASGVNAVPAAPVNNADDNKPKTIQDRFKNAAASFDARRRGVEK